MASYAANSSTIKSNKIPLRLALPVLAMCLASSVLAPSAAHARNWALLIGTGTYDDANHWHALPFTKIDIEELEDTLINRGNYAREHVTTLYDKNHDDLWHEIQEFFKTKPLMKEDLLLLYFTGHGWEKNGKLYLVPKDFKMEQPDATGIDISELRKQLQACDVKNKVIIIDACDAGTKDQSVPASKIQDALNVQGVVTLASSKQKQESYPMRDGKHSLYSYWLIEALKGHADQNSDGQVNIDEVHQFVEERVRSVAKKTIGVDQTPRREIGLDVPGTPAVLTQLKPVSIDKVLDDMAEQIASVVSFERLGPIAVYPDFNKDVVTLGGVQERSAKLPLSTSLAESLHKRLQKRMKRYDIQVYDYNLFTEELKGVMKSNATSNARTVSERAAAKVAGNADTLVQVQGKLVQKGSVLLLHAEANLVTRQGALVAVTQAGGRASLARADEGAKPAAPVQLAVNEFPLTGKSVCAKEEDWDPNRRDSIVTGNTLSAEEAAIENWDTPERLESNPNRDKSFPFKVSIWLKGKHEPERIIPRENDAYVGLDKDEEYYIRVDYNIDEPVHMKLLVDGVSTRNHEAPTGVDAANQKGLAKWRQLLTKSISVGFEKTAPSTLLSDATAWVLPKEDTNRAVYGFYIQDNDGLHHQNGYYYPFVVADAAESVAAERGYTDEIGLITAVFYKDKKEISRGVGTKAGALKKGEAIEKTDAGVPGRMLGCVNIHYISRQAVKELPAE